jgi:hypothetical protein
LNGVAAPVDGDFPARAKSSSCRLPFSHQIDISDALGVDPNEDLGDALFIDCRVELDRLERIVLQVAEAVDRVLEAFLGGVVDRFVAMLLEAGEVSPRRLLEGAPDDGDVRNELGIGFDRRVGDLETRVLGTEGNPDATDGEVLADDLGAGQHGKQRRQALLPVDDQEAGGGLLAVGADLASSHLGARPPEQQIADWKALVHRVEEVANLGVRPDERALDVR